MVNIELSSIQKQALVALLTEHRSTGEPVKARVIADAVDRTPRTVGSVMRSLADLSLVEGTQGPAGGYEPTDRAYEIVDADAGSDPDTVTLAHEYERLDVPVEEIQFIGVHDPEQCRARLHLRRAVHQFEGGDAVAVGPTPLGDLVLAGEIVTVDETNGELLVEVTQLQAPVETSER